MHIIEFSSPEQQKRFDALVDFAYQFPNAIVSDGDVDIARPIHQCLAEALTKVSLVRTPPHPQQEFDLVLRYSHRGVITEYGIMPIAQAFMHARNDGIR